jgi:photosystem II stability/assembly factor-like uncharacterized protein
MKLGKSHIHLFILLFAVSSILVHVPSDAYAAVDTWTAATTTNVGTNTMNGVSMSDANNGVAVGHSGQIVYTTNGGVDWTNATTTNVGTGAIRGVSMSDANNGVAVGYMGTIVYTTNGGVDWTAATTTNVSAASMRGVSMIDASNGVAVGQSGQIVYTTNGGVDWTDATTTNVGGTFMLGVSMGDASNGVAVGYSGTIVYTTNGGVDWTAATTTNVGTAYMWGVSMGDANNGVAVGQSGQIVFAGSVSSEDNTTTEKSSSDCYDCEAPKLTKVKAHVLSSPLDYTWNFDQDTPYPMFDDDIIPIVADPGDEVEIILELTDNRTLKRIADSGTYTNFLTKPNDMNTFYANNFDEYGKVSTTFYEWHNTGDDLFYDYDQTVEWSDADITIQESGEFVKDGTAENLDGLVGTFTISFKMKFLEPMKTSEVWVQATDRSGNFFKVALPLTLKITGNEPLVFESKVNQKVLSFYDGDILSEVVSDWNGSSQDVSELAVILGIPDEQLLPWVTNLAVWVSEDRITLADMIVSIEYLINN